MILLIVLCISKENVERSFFHMICSMQQIIKVTNACDCIYEKPPLKQGMKNKKRKEKRIKNFFHGCIFGFSKVVIWI